VGQNLVSIHTVRGDGPSSHYNRRRRLEILRGVRATVENFTSGFTVAGPLPPGCQHQDRRFPAVKCAFVVDDVWTFARLIFRDRSIAGPLAHTMVGDKIAITLIDRGLIGRGAAGTARMPTSVCETA
jgi:hypothetical protein